MKEKALKPLAFQFFRELASWNDSTVYLVSGLELRLAEMLYTTVQTPINEALLLPYYVQ